MLKKYFYIILPCLLIYLNGCGVLIFNEEKMAQKRYQIQEEQYKPYQLKNTIEGYKEFIDLYPKNTFVDDAKSQIDVLEFSPYEKADNIEGYMEFKMRYPKNRYVSKANWSIEQVEIKRYEKMDSIEGYREFLLKYPESIFAVLAMERLQELEIRELDRDLSNKYGFDLLQYRLSLKRLKNKLPDLKGISLGDYNFFAMLADIKGKRYFHTSLIYPYDLSHLDASSSETSAMFFDNLLSVMLEYLHNYFKSNGEIDGFSFDISSSEHGFHGDKKVFLEYCFRLDKVNLFAGNKLDKQSLLAGSRIIILREVAVVEKKAFLEKHTSVVKSSVIENIASTQKSADIGGKSLPEEEKPLPVKMDGTGIMTVVRDAQNSSDHIISLSCELVSKSGQRHTMKTIEKWKDFRYSEGIKDKSIRKYIDPPFNYGRSILTVNYNDRERAFWYCEEYGDAGRISNTERLRPPAESDFSLTDYIEINIEEEKHKFLKNEDYAGGSCFLVESVPVIKKSRKYEKRISWIDSHDMLPLKVEYFNGKGELCNILTVEWQKKFGFWFWKKAEAHNVQTGYKTFFETEDVRVNVGFNERDFTRFVLEQKR
jgi:hypothetical protein